MYNITLLSSFHQELGKCNSDELYKIIENIQPEIIFEELPYDLFDIIYTLGYDPKSLEAIAIKKYLKLFQIEHFPVDTCDINESEVFNGYDLIFNKSIEYTKLFKHQLSMLSQYGYSFLNSNNFVELLDKMHIVEENVLLESNNMNLLNQYKSYNELNDKREFIMLQNIYNISRQYQYNNAMFICGAEHRKSIIQKILEYERKEKTDLNWTFYGNQNFKIVE